MIPEGYSPKIGDKLRRSNRNHWLLGDNIGEVKWVGWDHGDYVVHLEFPCKTEVPFRAGCKEGHGWRLPIRSGSHQYWDVVSTKKLPPGGDWE